MFGDLAARGRMGKATATLWSSPGVSPVLAAHSNEKSKKFDFFLNVFVSKLNRLVSKT